jgi:Zn finger protein HypA/HybF involved in hydrogenase expression
MLQYACEHGIDLLVENVVVADQLERMRAIVAQAIAEAKGHPLEIHLLTYGDMAEAQVLAFFAEASKGTSAEGVAVMVQRAGSRYICWNCCGLRFESEDGVCPNCGESALEVPEEIDFALRKVEAG